jgi:elongation factor P--beta-lysine ligase
MSGQKKKDGVLMRDRILKDWDRLLGKEVIKIRVLIKNYAREENGIIANASFDLLCDYLAMCNQLRILVQAFLESMSPHEISVRISSIEHMAYKTLAKSIEILRNRLRDEYHISMEPI